MTSLPADAVHQISSLGHCIVTLDTPAAQTLGELLAHAQDFFTRPRDAKNQHTGRAANYGFRPFGIEYSQTPERPDYNECFTYWASRWDLIPASEQIEPFLTALESWTQICADLTHGLLRGLADKHGATSPPFAGASHLQINSAFPAPPEREFLQDLHEDGHLLTVLHSTDVGLEVSGAGAVTLASDEILIFSGSILTLITDGAIEPTYHQVRNHGLSERFSVMYFVNPELTEPIHPWSADSSAWPATDLRDAVRRNPLAFGLPEVEEL